MTLDAALGSSRGLAAAFSSVSSRSPVGRSLISRSGPVTARGPLCLPAEGLVAFCKHTHRTRENILGSARAKEAPGENPLLKTC